MGTPSRSLFAGGVFFWWGGAAEVVEFVTLRIGFRTVLTIPNHIDKKGSFMNTSERPNLGRHAANCNVCKHPQRDEIEDEFLAWEPIQRICRSFKLINRSSIYRHARAFNLMA